MRLPVFLLSLLLSVAAWPARSQSPNDQSPSNKHVVDRPWEIRFILNVSEQPGLEIAAKRAKARQRSGSNRLPYYAIFEPASTIAVPLADLPTATDAFASILIEFEKTGTVVTSNTIGRLLRGELTRSLWVNLADTATPGTEYPMGIWYMGRDGNDAHMVPALCAAQEVPSPTGGRSAEYRYHPRFKPSVATGSFGCREWAYQLYDQERPYIDVTSYEKEGSYLRPFIGFGRFDVPPKPVIAQHQKQWMCLYECPSGEKPGLIPHIREWARRNGWPVPQRPKRMPMFPDRTIKTTMPLTNEALH